MSPVSPAELSAGFADVTDVKDSENGDDTVPPKINKSTMLIAAVEENEPVVTRRELWSYYRALSLPKFHAFCSLTTDSLLQRGQCKAIFHLVHMILRTQHLAPQGVGPLGYTQTLFQSLATSAGYDPTIGPGSSCLSDTASGQCVLPWMGGTKSIAGIVLISNGISFAIMTAIFTTIGSAGDYGTFGRWLLFTVTIICWAAQYACMALTCTCRVNVGVARH